MLNANIFGADFIKTSTLDKPSKFIEWNFNSLKNNVSFYVDNAIVHYLRNPDNRKNYGWLLESKFVTQEINLFCKNNLFLLKENFINIFTHDKMLLNLDFDFFKFVPANGTWIKNIEIRNKSKIISMITSKKIFTQGHKKRLEIAEKYSNKIDLYGRGFKEIALKEHGLDDYMFSICVENGLYESYFTEKILDCFATGTIPVYLGTSDIDNFFDRDGIIILDDSFDIQMLSREFYLSKLKSIKYNLEQVKKFYVLEDWMYEQYFG